MNIFLKSINALKEIKPYHVGKVKSLMTSSRLPIKVAVVGASGGIGQKLCLLMKMSPFIKELTLYDIVDCPGVAADLSHINTKAKVTHYEKPSLLGDAMCGKDIIVIVAGKPRSPGMTRSDLFQFNADIVAQIVDAKSKTAPNAMVCLVTNPLNSLLPIAAGVLKKAKAYDPRKLFGVTTLDCVRASTFAAELMCYDASQLVIPVIGGHSGTTIVPVFSQASSPIKLPKDTMKALVLRVQHGGTEVLEAMAGRGSATISTAFSTARFIFSLCRAIKGEDNVFECAMVQSDFTDAEFFANRVLLGPKGVEKNCGYGKLTPDECCLVETAVKDLVKEIKVGADYLKDDNKEMKKNK